MGLLRRCWDAILDLRLRIRAELRWRKMIRTTPKPLDLPKRRVELPCRADAISNGCLVDWKTVGHHSSRPNLRVINGGRDD